MRMRLNDEVPGALWPRGWEQKSGGDLTGGARPSLSTWNTRPVCGKKRGLDKQM